jgi:hypothetical protein
MLADRYRATGHGALWRLSKGHCQDAEQLSVPRSFGRTDGGAGPAHSDIVAKCVILADNAVVRCLVCRSIAALWQRPGCAQADVEKG